MISTIDRMREELIKALIGHQAAQCRRERDMADMAEASRQKAAKRTGTVPPRRAAAQTRLRRHG